MEDFSDYSAPELVKMLGSRFISLSTFLLLMKAVGCINDLNDLMPEQPESLYLYNKKNKKVQRVRHKKV